MIQGLAKSIQALAKAIQGLAKVIQGLAKVQGFAVRAWRRASLVYLNDHTSFFILIKNGSLQNWLFDRSCTEQ